MAIVIKIKMQASGNRIALYQPVGSTSKYWHSMPVRQALKAIKDGKVSIGLSVDEPVVAA